MSNNQSNSPLVTEAEIEAATSVLISTSENWSWPALAKAALEAAAKVRNK